MVYVEPAFPRGTKPQAEITKNVPKKRFMKHVKYGASTEKDVKTRHLRPKERRRALLKEKEKEEEEHELAYNAKHLSLSTIQEGMLVLGCVQHIYKMELFISLPGRLFGTVPISAISDAYSKRLQEMMQINSLDCPALHDLYTVGDLVYIKVISKIHDTAKLMLSLKPADLHSQFVPSQLVPGLVLAASVAVEEDHGYSMETGIRDVRAFLPYKSLHGKPPTIGRNLICAVEKVIKLGKNGAMLILKAFRQNERYKLNVDMVNLDMMVPGCVVRFTIGMHLENGLKGTLFDDTLSAYVNQQMLAKPTSVPQSYSLFQQLEATLLYVMPVTKQVFVSLIQYKNNRIEPDTTWLPGSKIDNACVAEVCMAGVWFHFNNGRAIMPKKTIMNALGKEANYDDTINFGKYHVGSIHMLSVVRYILFDRTYIVQDSLHNAASAIEFPMDVQIGETYKCQITHVNRMDGEVYVQLGNVKGKASKSFFERNIVVKEGRTVPMKAVLHQPDMLYVEFTNRSEFLRSSAKILHDWKQIVPNEESQTFDGVVIEEETDHFVVAFFNDIRGILYKEMQNMFQYNPLQNRLQCGTVARFTIQSVVKSKLLLSMPIGRNVQSVETGQATVTGIYPTGVDVLVEQQAEQGTIPLKYFSAFSEHNCLFVNLLKEGHQLKVVKLSPVTYSVRDVRYFQQKPILTEHVHSGDILRASCFVRNGKVYANLLLSDYPDSFPIAEIDENDVANFYQDKIIMVKVISKQKTEQRNCCLLKVSSSLKDVCPRGIENVYSYMVDYLEDVICLIERYRQSGMSFANYNIGQKVVCTIETLFENSDHMNVKVHDDLNPANAIKGMAKKAMTGPTGPRISYNVGDQLEGRIVWVDVERQLLHVCVDPMLLQCIEEEISGGSNTLVKTGQICYCWVLFKNEYVRVCCMKKGTQNPLVLVPVRHHYNDLTPFDDDEPTIGVLLWAHLAPLIFGMHKDSYDTYNSYEAQGAKNVKMLNVESANLLKKSRKNRKTNKKKSINGPLDSNMSVKKHPEEAPSPIKGELIQGCKVKKRKQKIGTGKRQHVDSIVEVKTAKKKKHAPFVIDQLDGGGDDFLLSQLDGAETEAPSKKATKRTRDNKKSNRLPGTTNFWDNTPVYKRLESDSSEDDDSGPEENDRVRTKKRLTAKERFEVMKQEEDRLRKIEEELANPSIDPHTPDQFDRLVLAQPNNSLLWIRYMVFHMESAELDKARAVARKALKAINFREEADLLNVWVALLNLEIRYESVDSFKDVLQEAIQYNDAFKIYSRVLDILIDCQKLTEARDLLELLQKKFRKQNDMWCLVADAWYRIGKGSKVKPLLSQALKSLPNRDHISVIVKFAFLHNRNENRDEAHLLFEQILTSYPKRTDIWSQYVDMLVKDGLVENARQILERAVVQRLPLKNMKTLYTKYVNFEEKHGDRDSVRRVKQMATDYVQTQLNNAGVKAPRK